MGLPADTTNVTHLAVVAASTDRSEGHSEDDQTLTVEIRKDQSPVVPTLGDGNFEALVNRDVRGQADAAEQAHLRTADEVGLQRWLDVLIRMRDTVDEQKRVRSDDLERMLAANVDRDLYLEANAAYSRWHKKASFFRRGLDNRISEAKRLIRSIRSNRMIAQEERRRWKDQAAVLLDQAAILVPETGPGAEWHAAYRRLRG